MFKEMKMFLTSLVLLCFSVRAETPILFDAEKPQARGQLLDKAKAKARKQNPTPKKELPKKNEDIQVEEDVGDDSFMEDDYNMDEQGE